MHWLHKPKASVFIYWRLMLRRAVAIADVAPFVAHPKAILVSIVVIIHSDLGHDGILHLLEECSTPEVYATAIEGRTKVAPSVSGELGVPG